jgi:hypothetical protein
MSIQELIWGLVGFLLTVMVLSYLIGDNFIFRLAAYLFVGVTAGLLTVLIARQILWPYLLQPLISGSVYQRLWILIPLVLSLFLIISQFPRFSSFGRIPLAFLAGITAAIVVGGAVFGTIIPQTRAVVNSFSPVGLYAEPGRAWMRILDAGLMLLGVIGTLSYFHFGRRFRQGSVSDSHARPRISEAASKFGQVFIGLALGAVFAGIFSSALLALIDRLMFLGQWIAHWLGAG